MSKRYTYGVRRYMNRYLHPKEDFEAWLRQFIDINVLQDGDVIQLCGASTWDIGLLKTPYIGFASSWLVFRQGRFFTEVEIPYFRKPFEKRIVHLDIASLVYALRLRGARVHRWKSSEERRRQILGKPIKRGYHLQISWCLFDFDK